MIDFFDGYKFSIIIQNKKSNMFPLHPQFRVTAPINYDGRHQLPYHRE